MKEVNVGMCVYINLLEMGNMCESGLVCACERMNERERVGAVYLHISDFAALFRLKCQHHYLVKEETR